MRLKVLTKPEFIDEEVDSQHGHVTDKNPRLMPSPRCWRCRHAGSVDRWPCVKGLHVYWGQERPSEAVGRLSHLAAPHQCTVGAVLGVLEKRALCLHGSTSVAYEGLCGSSCY